MFTGNDRGSFNRDPFGQNDQIAWCRTVGTHQLVFVGFAEHLSNDNRPTQTGGNFGVTADQGDPDAAASLERVVKNLFDQRFGGQVFRQ